VWAHLSLVASLFFDIPFSLNAISCCCIRGASFRTTTAIACCYLVLCSIWTTSLPRAYASSQAIPCLQWYRESTACHGVLMTVVKLHRRVRFGCTHQAHGIHAIGVDRMTSAVMSSLGAKSWPLATNPSLDHRRALWCIRATCLLPLTTRELDC
jgi:hypothetical protein